MTSFEKLNKITSEINSQDELQLLEEINNSIKNLDQIRKSKINELSTRTTTLTNQINIITKEINELNRINDENYSKLSIPETSPIRKSSNIFHIILIKKQELDNLKVEIIKESQLLHTSISNLTLEERNLINKLNELIEKINRIDEDNSKIVSEQDPSMLKINLYKNLGIKLETGNSHNSDDGDNDDMMIITNQDDNTSNILKVEPKLSDFFISNYIWDKL
ncbi:MAG: kinetochore protein SPC24 [Asgard group archaeon]|nr:kinetochore protein SPC24 [Asgard group archaeon]